MYDELVALRATDRYTRLVGRAGAAEGAANLLATAAAAPLSAVGDFRLLGALSVAVCLVQVPLVLSFPETPRTAAAGEPGGAAGYFRTLRAGVGEVVRRPRLRRVVLVASLVPMAFDEYIPLLAREIGVENAQVPVLLLVPLLAMTAAGLLVGARTIRMVATPLALTGLLVIAGALSGSVPGVVAVGLAIGVYQVSKLVLEARIQAEVTGNARATVTSVAGLLAEASGIAVFAAFGVGAAWLDIRWLFALDGLVVLLLAAYAALALRAQR